MATWFTADLHFGHAKILDYCKRPFASLEAMHEQLITRYCQAVQPGDDIYILGDLAFCDPTPFFARLPGRKHLIVGNHDRRRSKLKKLSWNWIKDVVELKLDGHQIWLSHYPHLSWPSSSHGSWHLHGHTHGDSPAGLGRLDVGVDCWDYAPVNWETIKSILSKQPPRKGHHDRAD